MINYLLVFPVVGTIVMGYVQVRCSQPAHGIAEQSRLSQLIFECSTAQVGNVRTVCFSYEYPSDLYVYVRGA